MLNKLKCKVELLTTESGGRKRAITNDYRPCIKVNNIKYISLLNIFEEELKPGSSTEGLLEFGNKTVQVEFDTKYKMFEGEKLIGNIIFIK